MNDPRRALEVFDRALRQAPALRAAFVREASAGDDALRVEVEALLAADAAAGGDFLAPLAPSVRERAGERVGPWRLVRELGHGGMGTVWLAERADALYDKRVALKLLRFDAGDLRARFDNERHILAALEHPHIARLLDAGSDAHGAPYVALEYVEGESLTQWCDARGADLRTRLALFLKVLDAVQAAHGRLVVHRDLKPANILVDAHGTPKLLDFGVAKLLDGAARGLTRTGPAPLTPEYASPEQLRGDVVGTAADIYSLGVLLYELVAGARPYAIATDAPSGVLRAIEAARPRRPSLVAPRARRIGRDLDHVVLKAMAKEPRERYASCAQFSDDLRRHLAGEPVLAFHAGALYRARKFVRRHRVGVAVAVFVALTLAASAVVALTQAHAAREQARLARAERDKARQVNAFLQDMLAAADPADLGRNATVAQVLDRAQQRAERELAADPDMLAPTELTLSRTYAALGDLDAAVRTARIGLQAAQRLGTPGALFDARFALGSALVSHGDYAQAADELAQARTLAVDGGTALQRGSVAHQLGILENARGNAAQALRWHETALAELPPEAADERAQTMNDVAVVKGSRGDFAGALALHREAVDSLRRAHPAGGPLLAQAIGNLAVSLNDNGRHDEANAAFDESLRMEVDLLGEHHPVVVNSLASMAFSDLANKNVAAALEHGRRAWQAGQFLSENHPSSAYADVVYAQALMDDARPREALPLLEAALAIRKARYGEDHPLFLNTQTLLALARARTGDVAGGEALARAAYGRLQVRLGDRHELVVAARQRVAQIEALEPHAH